MILQLLDRWGLLRQVEVLGLQFGFWLNNTDVVFWEISGSIWKF